MEFHTAVALITPFDESGRIDFSKVEELIDFQIVSQTDAIVCCGSTGEGSALDEVEWEELLSCVICQVDGEIPVIANSGTNATISSVRRTEEAMRLGADGVLAVTPYYCKPSFLGCKAHFEAICNVGLPTIFYYHPVRTGVRWTPDQVAEIADIDGIVGVKDASGDLLFSEQWTKLSVKPLYVGNDDQLISLLKIGAKGIISSIGNLIPRELKRIVSLYLEGRGEEAEEKFASYYDLIDALFKETNPQGIKCAMGLAELCSPRLRLPLLEPPEENVDEIREEMEKLGILEPTAM